ncbi:MAG: diguanylate cyclase [Ruminococcus sp.]|nr:diguanylate cyclase [Ruminococcus sp.]
MNTAEKKIKTSKRNTVLALVMLLMTNVLLSISLVGISKYTLREQMNQRMLDIANTAAYMLNGDELGALTAEDAGTEPYHRALDTLRAFQENIQLDYIYGIKDMGDGTFTFTIDPDPDDPGEFGSPIATTDALVKASKGTPSVDMESYEDEWGRFYSAYSPVYDSQGNITGIVGVDFNAEWYDGKLNSIRMVALGITAAALLVGVGISLIMMTQNRKRFADMMKTIGELDAATQRLDRTILQSPKNKLGLRSEGGNAALKAISESESTKKAAGSEYEELSSSLTSVYGRLKNYVEYIDSEVYTDQVTDTGNKAAYKLRISKLDEAIAAGKAKFTVAFFDINGLKKVYVAKGYEAGDALMFECARLIKKLFGGGNVFHVTGDEFVVITDEAALIDTEILLAKFESELRQYNSGRDEEYRLSVAKGAAAYKPNRTKSFRQVFIEAKEKCDKDKAEYYARINKSK